jgi:hypothetical protein
MCRACRSIDFEFNNNPNLINTLLLKGELKSINHFKSFETHPITRELERFLAEYKSGHWEPALLYLGRATEALVFALARYHHLEIRRPRIKSLKKIDSAYRAILDNAKNMLATMESDENLKKKIIEQTKSLASAAHDIQLELDTILKAKAIPNHDEQDVSYALKQLEAFYGRAFGKKNYDRFCAEISIPCRKILNARNMAAHPDRNGKRKTTRKVSVKQSFGELHFIAQALSSFLKISVKDA